MEFEGLEQPPEAAVAEPAAKQEPQGWRQGSGDSWARENPSVIVKGCPNCGSKVPQDKWTLHEAVCYRQNFGACSLFVMLLLFFSLSLSFLTTDGNFRLSQVWQEDESS